MFLIVVEIVPFAGLRAAGYWHPSWRPLGMGYEVDAGMICKFKYGVTGAVAKREEFWKMLKEMAL
jgi:hypothetical protein